MAYVREWQWLPGLQGKKLRLVVGSMVWRGEINGIETSDSILVLLQAS